jgi:beta-aspartyl-peptidase (threonine type)
MLMPIEPPRTEELVCRQEIEALLDNQAAAWNRGDVEGFMAGYWRSAEVSFSSGKEIFRGWQATLDRYQSRYRANGCEMGQLLLSHLEIDLLNSDSAFARGRWQVSTRQSTMSGLFTLILRKFPEGWRIIHDHTSA